MKITRFARHFHSVMGALCKHGFLVLTIVLIKRLDQSATELVQTFD